MSKLKKLLKRGDTIIEVTLAITVFSLVSVITIQLMDRDVAIIQGTLESEMARNEIDAQAEALRFIQNAYLSEREIAQGSRQYMDIWLKLSRTPSDTVGKAGHGLTNDPKKISQYTSVPCSTYYNTSNSTDNIHNIFEDRAFVINTRKLDPANIPETIIQSKDGTTSRTNIFKETQLYPRIIYSRGGTETIDEAMLSENYPSGMTPSNTTYNKVARAEGVWVISARAETKGSTTEIPEFYDFHIRTCWFAPGHDRPSTIATTIRLYNPELVEAQIKNSKSGKDWD